MRYFPVTKIPQGADLDTIYSGNYFCNTQTLHQSILHKPSGATTIWRLHVISITNDGVSAPSTANEWMKRIQILEDENGAVFQRTIKGLGSTSPVIGEWEKLPTRAEVDTLNSRLNGYITIENFTITIGQCKPGVDYRQSVSVSKEGYRPFGIIGYDVLGTYGSWFQVTKLGIVDWNTATVVLRAPAGEFTTDNTAVKITVLYQKT